jgi:phage shock protein A
MNDINKNPADLSGMNAIQAKDYILQFVTTLKLTEKELSKTEEEISKWRTRTELAISKNMSDLANEAHKEFEKVLTKYQTLKTEIETLKLQIKEMQRQIPMLAAKERSVNPDLLEQELLIAAGYNPGEQDKVKSDIEFIEMEKNFNTEAALQELKAKMKKAETK